MGHENAKSISPPCKLRSNGKSNTDTVEYRLRQSESRRKRGGGVISRIDTELIRIETHKAFVETAVDIQTSTNSGAAKPFLSITAASCGSPGSCNSSGEFRCIFHDTFIIHVHERNPEKCSLFVRERVLLHPRAEIATRRTPMNVARLRTGGGGLLETTRRRRRRSPSSHLRAVSLRSAVRRLMNHVSLLVYVPRYACRGYDTNGAV
jgi:hypothetical protein